IAGDIRNRPTVTTHVSVDKRLVRRQGREWLGHRSYDARIPADARPRRPFRLSRIVDPLPGEPDHELRCAIEQGRSLSDIVQPLGADLELPDRVDDETGGHVADELAANRAPLDPALDNASRRRRPHGTPVSR